MTLPPDRHSRARGNPLSKEYFVQWIPAFAGMTKTTNTSLVGVKQSIFNGTLLTLNR